MIKVVGWRVLIKVKDPETKTATGIILPIDEKMARAKMEQGVIIQIGAQAWKDARLGGEPWAKVGDRVVFAKAAGKFVADPDSGEEFLLINDEDIQMVIGEEND